jgi:hypothetical protein
MPTRPPVSYLPSVASLEALDDRQLGAEVGLAQLREQVVVVRALADQIERLAEVADAGALRERVVEAVARLGCQLLEVAASMAASERSEASGVFLRPDALLPKDAGGPTGL